MTCEQKYEALTTVEAVQKALNDGRAVECMWFGSDGWRPVTPKDDYDVAYFTCHGVQYRAPAASVGDAVGRLIAELRDNPLSPRDVRIAHELAAAINAAPAGLAEVIADMRVYADKHDDEDVLRFAQRVDALAAAGAEHTHESGVVYCHACALEIFGAEALFAPESPSAAPTSPHDVDAGEKAPRHNLPTWGECADRVANSDYVAKRKAEGGYGEDPDGMYANALHRFIYEYDDADKFKSGWFMYRLQLVVDELTSRPHDVDAVLVDEAMVERALAAHAAEPKEYQHEIDYRVYQRDAMRAALTAALRKPGEA